MADRTVSYVFKGQFTNLTAGLAAAGKSVGALGTELTAMDAKGKKARTALGEIGATAGKFGLVAAGGLAAIVKVTADFDKAMSVVQADTHETAANMDLLRAAAIKAGADTAFSASQAADGIDQLAKAGVSTKDILAGGLSGALNLAAAGGVSVGDAAETAASALTQFGLAGSDVNHVADLLAAGAGKAQGSVGDLSYALKYAGVPAHALGVSIDTTTGVLAEFASTGIVGSQAGTTLRSMLLSLAAPTSKASAVLSQYGINMYDASGKFVGLSDAAQQLKTQLGPLTEAQRNAALSTIFGQNAIQGAITLYNGGGAAVDGWTAKVNDAGYAAQTAAARMNNLSGDLESLKGSLETALIGAGSGSQSPLRSLVQTLTNVTNAFNKLPASAQGSVTSLLAITAVTGGSLWFGSKVLSGVTNTRTALNNLSDSSSKASRALGGLAKAGIALAALEAAGAILRSLDQAAAGAAPNVEALTASLISADQTQFSTSFGASLKDTLATVDASGASLDGFANSLNNVADKGGTVGRGIEQATTGFFGMSQATEVARMNTDRATGSLASLDAALTGLVSSGGPARAQKAFAALASAQGLTTDEQARLLQLLPGYTSALQGSANTASLAGEKTTFLGSATSKAALAARNLTAATDAAVKSMQDQKDAALNAFDAETQLAAALRAATAQGKKSNAGIDSGTKAAGANRDALSALAAGWNNQSAAVQNSSGRYKEMRTELIAAAKSMGVGKQEAIGLADSLLHVPRSVVAKITADSENAAAKVARFKQILASLPITHDTTITTHYVDVRSGVSAASVLQGGIPAGKPHADGGYIAGPGGPRDDVIPAWLSNGEFVVNAAATARNLALLHSLNAQKFAEGGQVGGGAASGDPFNTRALTIPDIVGSLQALNDGLHGLNKHEIDVRKNDLDRLTKQLDNQEKKRADLAKKELDAAKSRLDSEVALRTTLVQAVAGQFTGSPFSGLDPTKLPTVFNAAPPAFSVDEIIKRQQYLDQIKAKGILTPELLSQLGTSASTDELMRLAGYTSDALTFYAAQYAATSTPIGAANQQASDAKKELQLLKQLKAEGLTGAAFADAAQNASLDQLAALAASGSANVQAYSDAINQRDQLAQQAGAFAGDSQFGAQISGLRADYKKAAEVNHKILAENKTLNHEVTGIKRDLAVALKHIPKNVGHEVGAVINGAMRNGVTRRTPR